MDQMSFKLTAGERFTCNVRTGDKGLDKAEATYNLKASMILQGLNHIQRKKLKELHARSG